MKRWLLVSMGLALALCSQPMYAQHHGRHGAGANAPTGAPSGSDDLIDFKRAVALQATPEQIARFQQSTKSLAAARESAQHLLPAGKENNSNPLDDLSYAIEDAQTDNAKFLASFSDAQRSGLKEYIKKISKANNELTKQSKSLQGSKYEPLTVRKIDRALAEMQTNQVTMGTEMGISNSVNTQ
jgi:hypothetical protein